MRHVHHITRREFLITGARNFDETSVNVCNLSILRLEIH